MWTIRSGLVKVPIVQRLSVTIIGRHRGLTTSIVDQLPTSTNKETNNDSADTVTEHLTTSVIRTQHNKRKEKRQQNKRRLSSILRHKVEAHGKLHQGKQRAAFIQPVLLEESKQDLDISWSSLRSSLPVNSKYQRIYPNKVIPVATLAPDLQRTLFKPGVHPIKDFQTKQRLFSQYWENITQPDDFDYEAMQPYITSSKDKNLIEMAKNQNARYVGSTSSLSGILSHIYFELSNHRPVDTSVLSRSFVNESKNYTRGSRVPKTIMLRWKDGVYAVDADKAFDSEETILSQLGKSMEKFLTLKPSDYERYLKENSGAVTEEERNAPEAFAYGMIGNLFLRSQLDCYHSLLPRRTFDLKTRAIMPIRLDIPHYQDYYNYKLEQHRGMFYSFEREYYDMMRSAFLKYSFQVRIGHMDGVMVTYHNTDEIFGFQYISRSEMDARLFGTSKMGDEAFEYCLMAMQNVFDKATSQFKNQV
ncbi:mitochondrial protein Pet127-domain-containing protein [Chlamydoabsidia padenii]|nr:mitochondrial protein Pet127-domain-containing protein [Chlamydoabsidia padenii]